MSTDNVTDRARGPNSIAPLGTKGEVPTRSNAVSGVAALAAPAIDAAAIEAPRTAITAASAATTCLKRTSDRCPRSGSTPIPQEQQSTQQPQAAPSVRPARQWYRDIPSQWVAVALL